MTEQNGSIVFLDANVLVQVRLTDLLLTMVEEGLFEARCSHQVFTEAHRAMTQRLGRPAAATTSYLAAVEKFLGHHAVVENTLTSHTFGLPDRGDEHVLTSALLSEANCILTFNIKDFPNPILKSHDISARDPDSFLLELWHDNPDGVLESINRFVSAHTYPPRTVVEELKALAVRGIPQFASLLINSVTDNC